MSPTTFRATLYFGIAFLTPFAQEITTILKDEKWPSGPKLVLGILVGAVAGLVALRAYYDGSALRNAQETGTGPTPSPAYETPSVSVSDAKTNTTETLPTTVALPDVKPVTIPTPPAVV